MEFKFQVQTKIRKPLQEVFQAVYDPKKLSGYFTNGGASGPLDEGASVNWTFADQPGQEMTVPVKVKKMVPNELIQFTWAASEGVYDAATNKYPHPGGYDTVVEVHFSALGPKETLVKISEGSWRESQAGLEGSYQNCQGWMHMACCLKAYLEFNIDLRKGCF